VIPNQDDYFLYTLSKDKKTGNLHTETKKIYDPNRETLPIVEGGYSENQLSIHFDSEEGNKYILHLVRELDHFTRDDFEVLNAFIALSKITIDNTYLYKKMTEQKKMETEIEIAREIQLGLLPSKVPQFPGYEFSGIMDAARGVGGDYYDFVISPDKKDVVICIGDVSGKGVGAGMVMATVRTILHSLVRRKPTAKELLKDINTYLYYNYKDSTTPRFMTMIIINWSPETGIFHFAGAGHGTIFISRAREQLIEEIETKGIVLGIQPKIDSNIYEGEFSLNPQDSMLLYTDGVTEAINPKGQPFDEENLKIVYKKYFHLDAKDILNSIFQDINAFTGSQEQHDDITMVCIKRL
ncbi:MAG: PP2C family protein-serine/threonine phosphatase, partial [Leptospira sp.]|nr:PP2C family protein-serine/threonine phosphatase [Leptospira sp.]